MVESAHHRLSITAQCRLLRISRSSYYYAPVPETDETLALMTVIDATFLDCPWYGSRQMARHLRRELHQQAALFDDVAEVGESVDPGQLCAEQGNRGQDEAVGPATGRVGEVRPAFDAALRVGAADHPGRRAGHGGGAARRRGAGGAAAHHRAAAPGVGDRPGR